MPRITRRLAALGFTLPLMLLLCRVASAQDKSWPRELDTKLGVLTIYQPQPEKFEDNVLTARAAVSLIKKGTTTPVFGVFWFTGRVDTDRDKGTSMIRDILVTDSRWPESKEKEQQEFAVFLNQLMPKTGVPISLQTLTASLATAEQEKKSIAALKSDPPRIVVSHELAVLLLYDGKPRTMPVPNTDYEFVANASFAVVKDKKAGMYYLCGGKIWYSAKDPMGPWASIDQPPAEVAKLVPPDTTKTPAPAKPPKIVVATEPTELIAMDGEPKWSPVGDAELLYITNTDSKVIRDVSTG